MAWRRRKARERDLDRELRAHLDLETEEHRDDGLPVDQAHYAAQRALGNATLIKEVTRDMWGWTSVERLWQDLRYATRMFARSPGFVIAAVLSMALGIGGNAAMFSLVNALLIRPLPYAEPGALLRITSVYPKAALALFRERSRTMDIASASPGSESNLTRSGETVRATGSAVSDNLFSVLRIPAEMGRAFQPGEQRPGADGSLILSHALWNTAFHGNPQVIGSVATVDGMARQVVGVMPASFSYPSTKVQFWIPARLDPSDMEDYWGQEYVPFIARLRPGATLSQAHSEIRAMMDVLRTRFPFPMPRNWNNDATAISLQADMVEGIRGKLLVLFAAVGVVLLIACANVSSLLLSRAAARRKEIALRAALGAARSRIVRQLLTESVLLAALGAGSGLALAGVVLNIFKSVLPPGTASMAGVTIDWQVAGFVAGLAAMTGLAFGMVPALSTARIDLAGSMKAGSARATAPRGIRLRGWLIVGEVGLTVLLLVSAGLLLKSLYSMSQVNPGFSPEHILTVRLTPNQSICAQRESCVSLYGRLLEQARGISGTSEVAAANSIPLDGTLPTLPFDVEDHPKSADFPAPMFWTGAVTPGYFQVLRIPLLEGRVFTAGDGAKAGSVVIVTLSTARRFWPRQSAVGKHVKPVWDAQWRTVIGVVSDVRQFNLADRIPESISGAIYMPYPQAVQADHQIPAALTLLMKTTARPLRVAGEIRRMARVLNPDAPVEDVATLRDTVSESTADFRSTIWLFLSFAAAAIMLASVGIYGLVSNSVAQRTYEIGLRVAIGATRSEILRMMLAQSVRLTLMGIGVGVLASLVLTRFLAGMLFGVAATDVVTFTSACVLILGIAIVASYAPAWRAANLDPVRSLRAE